MDWFEGLGPLLQRIQHLLSSRGQTVAVAESCTGGLVQALLTERAGSSAVFLGGVTAYANSAKIQMLGVDQALIAAHGAVSAEVAAAMAKGAVARFGATHALSLTGIAGPGGGSAEKPVGTVFLGLAGPKGVRSLRLALSGDRGQIRRSAAERALGELESELG